MKRTAFALVVVLALAAIALAACGGTTGTGGGTGGGTTVVLNNLAFNPSSLQVSVGATVTFRNDDQVPHHIVVGNDDLGEQQPGTTKTWKAPSDGTYAMKCLIHPEMKGTITVGSGGSTIGTQAPSGSGTPGY